MEDGLGMVCKVGKVEKVTVPAGAFDTMSLEYTWTLVKDIEPLRFTEWHAHNVGLVKKQEKGRALASSQLSYSKE
jgi:hypothetical protein